MPCNAVRSCSRAVAPAIYGGFQIALATPSGQWITQRVNIPEGTQCVLFIPDEEMSTTEARKALPESLSYADAIHNISRASMLVNCFATGQFDPLRYAMQDKLHQQYRSHMFPFEPIIKVALEAGAHGAYLSGAGPTVLAITGGSGRANVGDDTMSHFLAEAVSEAMIRALPPHGTAIQPAPVPHSTRPALPPSRLASIPPCAHGHSLVCSVPQARRAIAASVAPRTSPPPPRWASSPQASPSRACGSGRSRSTARLLATRKSPFRKTEGRPLCAGASGRPQ